MGHMNFFYFSCTTISNQGYREQVIKSKIHNAYHIYFTPSVIERNRLSFELDFPLQKDTFKRCVLLSLFNSDPRTKPIDIKNDSCDDKDATLIVALVF